MCPGFKSRESHDFFFFFFFDFFLFIYLFFMYLFFLAHLSLLRMSFWDTVMSVVRRTCGRP